MLKYVQEEISVKENMKYLTNHYQLREFTLIRMLEIINQNKNITPGGTVFYGDSITEYCDLDKYYPEIETKYNCGIAGITSGMLLNFIDEGVIKYQPKNVVLMIGTNDLGNTVMESPRDIALNVKETIEIIHYNCLDTKIYLVAPLPCLDVYKRQKLYIVDMVLPWISHILCSFIPAMIMCKMGAPMVEIGRAHV